MYTKIGEFVAFFAVALGLFSIVLSFFFAPDIYAPDFKRADLAQSSRFMKEGAFLLVIGVALGVLTEISKKLKK